MQPTQREDATTGRVEIRVRGHLDARWSSWLSELTLTRETDGTTVLEGPVADQAALFGLLDRLRDLALPLISVLHVDPPDPPSATPTTSQLRSHP